MSAGNGFWMGLDWIVTCEAWSWYMPMAPSAGSVFGLSEYGLLSRIDDPGIVGVQTWEIKSFSSRQAGSLREASAPTFS
jgi:hypothetical protein